MNDRQPTPCAASVNGSTTDLAQEDSVVDPDWIVDDEGAIEVGSDLGRFAMIPEWIVLEPTISPLAVRLYCVLALRANRRSRECWPSQALLAQEVGVSDRTVRAALFELEAAGAITRTRRAKRDPATGQIARVSTLYRVKFRRSASPYRKQASARPNRKQISGATGSRLPTNQSQGTRETPTESRAVARTPLAEAKAETPQQRLVRLFGESFEKALGAKYDPQRKDFVIAAKLLREHPWDEVEARCVIALEKAIDDPWWHENVCLGLVQSQWRALGMRETAPVRRNGGAR